MHIAEEWVEWEYLEIFPASQDFVKVAFTKLNSISGEEEDESVSQFFHILAETAGWW